MLSEVLEINKARNFWFFPDSELCSLDGSPRIRRRLRLLWDIRRAFSELAPVRALDYRTGPSGNPVRGKTTKKNTPDKLRYFSWWLLPDSNWGHKALQASALPTELKSRIGADEETQTPGLFLGKEALYQLSYTRALFWNASDKRAQLIER